MILENETEMTKGCHKLVEVECDIKLSDKCKNRYYLKYQDYYKMFNKRQLVCCKPCSNILDNSNGGQRKYSLDNGFLNNIDSENKAYLLGWIASDGYISPKNRVIIRIHKKDIDIIYKLKEIMNYDIPINHYKNIVTLYINSKAFTDNCCRHLNLLVGKKASVVTFPELLNENLKWSFLRGYFDGDGGIINPSHKNRYPSCSIGSSSYKMLEQIKEFVKIPCSLSNRQISWNGNNCLDVLGKLYDNQTLYLKRKKDQYIIWSSWVKSLGGGNSCYKDNKIKINKCKNNAILPSKNRVSDSGYDVHIIDEIKRDGEVIFFGTGLKVTPPYGYYFDMVPRSSISKTGYISANSTGIIDRCYVGEVIVPLIKIDKNKPDLQLPYKICQLIPRPIEHFEIEETELLEDTNRGEKGFGSSGN